MYSSGSVYIGDIMPLEGVGERGLEERKLSAELVDIFM